ncbi:iron-containing alcohol dehydrogenase family protein [Peptococcaceae bacterium 1198_IL3148]
MQFNFHCPTKIFFGLGAINTNKSALSKMGQKAIIVTGGSSSKVNKSLEDMMSALNSEGIDYKVFDQVEQNPSLSTVYAGAKIASEFGADFIIGIGGGSPLDAAKAVAVLATNDLSQQDLMAKKWVTQPLPIVAVPTTAGTGSEVTPYAVLTVDWAETKMSISGDELFPAIAFLDPRYTINLPWHITINTAIDALSHSIEGFISKRATVFSDLLALESISIIGQLLQTMNEDNVSLSEREELLYASMLAGIVIAQTGTNVIHSLGYPLTYYKKLPHGLANGVLLKAALIFMSKESPEKVESLLHAMDCTNIEEFGQLLTKVQPAGDLKLTIEEQQLFVQKTLATKNIANCPATPSEQDLYDILNNSNLV